jgi:adenine deaminase
MDEVLMPSRGVEPFSVADWQQRIAVALGQRPADLALVNGQVVNVFSGELERSDVAVVGGRIAGVGCYQDAVEIIDCAGKVISPSFVDAHVHLESSLVWATEFARAVVPRGTGAVVTDPHEIANVAGLAGMRAMREVCAGLPLRVAFTVPSCVPASEHESPGASLGEAEIAEALAWPESVALGELMDFPGVLAANEALARKLEVARGHPIDGHAPGLAGPALQAYAGGGPGADHESTKLEEAREKLRAGLMVMIREGSSERNLCELLPLVTDATYPRCCFASDDRDCHTLLHDGHIDAILRSAIEGGLDPIRALRMATWNPAQHWGLDGIGAVAPGYRANIAVLHSLERVDVAFTIYQGVMVAHEGQLLTTLPSADRAAQPLRNSVHLAPLRISDLRLSPNGATVAVEVVPDQIVTRLANVTPVIRDGWAVSDPERDLLKLVCVERHRATGRTGVGYVRGFGLKRGAIASTIAHDAHNIVAVGVEDADILAAVATVAESQGGLAVFADGRILAHLPLPIAGLLSDRPLEEVAAAYGELERAARTLGSELSSPLGVLSFMALSVIPDARVTDRGFLRLGEAI